MAKSLRSKVKKRWRSLRKNYVEQVKAKPQLEAISKKLEATIVGVEYRTAQTKNAFAHPDDPSAQFFQYTPQKNIDLRSTSIPGSGNQYKGASRKFGSTITEAKTADNDNIGKLEDEQRMEEQKQHLKTTIKKDRNKKTKLRKIMVF